MRITLDLTQYEAEALHEDVTFDAGLVEEYGGHPASASLLDKINAALAAGEQPYACGPGACRYDSEASRQARR